MDNWKISIKIEDETDNIELIDIKSVLDGYLNINRTFFDELLSIVKMIRKYSVGKGIEKVIGPDNKDWTKNPWVFIMIQDSERKIPFWILLKRERDLNGYLVAIGPDKFYEYLKKSQEPDSEVKRILEYVVAYPQKFKSAILIPNFIA